MKPKADLLDQCGLFRTNFTRTLSFDRGLCQLSRAVKQDSVDTGFVDCHGEDMQRPDEEKLWRHWAK